MPKRIQRKRTKGWRMPENAVYVGRPSKWGNPFTGPDAVEKYREAISYRGSLESAPREIEDEWEKNGGDGYYLYNLAHRSKFALRQLRGKDLACWCPLDKPCHADILLEIANSVKPAR